MYYIDVDRVDASVILRTSRIVRRLKRGKDENKIDRAQ